jgi:hypothetical protein
VESLQRRIAPHLLRRVKEDVAKDIPPKEEVQLRELLNLNASSGGVALHSPELHNRPASVSSGRRIDCRWRNA